MYCWELLAEFKHTGTLSAGNVWRPTAVKTQKEPFEVVYMEIEPPVKDDGTMEDLARVYPVVDGVTIEEYVHLPGRYDRNLFPIKYLLKDEAIMLKFGEPLNTNPLLNTTLKCETSLSVVAYAGASNVTPVSYTHLTLPTKA